MTLMWRFFTWRNAVLAAAVQCIAMVLCYKSVSRLEMVYMAEDPCLYCDFTEYMYKRHRKRWRLAYCVVGTRLLL